MRSCSVAVGSAALTPHHAENPHRSIVRRASREAGRIMESASHETFSGLAAAIPTSGAPSPSGSSEPESTILCIVLICHPSRQVYRACLVGTSCGLEIDHPCHRSVGPVTLYKSQMEAHCQGKEVLSAIRQANAHLTNAGMLSVHSEKSFCPPTRRDPLEATHSDHQRRCRR